MPRHTVAKSDKHARSTALAYIYQLADGGGRACASQTKMAQSRAAEMMCPSPVQRTALTAWVWLPMLNRQRRVCASHTRTLLSLEPLASRRQGSATCAGSHATDVTHFVWPGMDYAYCSLYNALHLLQTRRAPAHMH